MYTAVHGDDGKGVTVACVPDSPRQLVTAAIAGALFAFVASLTCLPSADPAQATIALLVAFAFALVQRLDGLACRSEK